MTVDVRVWIREYFMITFVNDDGVCVFIIKYAQIAEGFFQEPNAKANKLTISLRFYSFIIYQ